MHNKDTDIVVKSRMLFPAVFGIGLLLAQQVCAVVTEHYVETSAQANGFCLADQGDCAALYVDARDHAGVVRAAGDLQADLQRVTGTSPRLVQDGDVLNGDMVLIGTLGKSPVIDRLAREQKIDVGPIRGQWESFLIQTVDTPLSGVPRALVIAGSDKRGTIYGIYDLSQQIGVSPWYWWADVPVAPHRTLYVKSGRRVQGPPAVKYRGIFLNDEEPCLGRWAVENYGGFTHAFYEKLFELILRLKGNFLWPAMWWASFNSDDPNNPRLADEYGVVMSTSHHEPMMRAHKEWNARQDGPWNYETNAEKLRAFWREGIERMGDRESVVTLAMRGDGDTAMSPDTNIALLEKIVADQREIIQEVTGRDVTTIPQVWALYKEVQDYYDKGMRVPDDVTLLLCDDNWGNVRCLPKADAPPRAGSYGMYYHFDFHGGPRSYEWLNTSPLPRIWEQMHLCYRHGVDRIWLVNVGDLKPMELPISFYLDYARDPQAWPAERLPEYHRLWARQQFGPEHAKAIADILIGYTKFNSRRKPESLGPDIYSLHHYREAETVVADYNALVQKAMDIRGQLPAASQDAFYQLVQHPAEACANLNAMYLALAKNRLYAQQGRAATADQAERVKALFEKDSQLSNYYNHELAGGKWNHMMDARHISFRSWNPPRQDRLPRLSEIDLPPAADMGVALEGSDQWWPDAEEPARLPTFDVYQQQTCFIEVFNRGREPFEFQARADQPWLSVSPAQGRVDKQVRLHVRIQWDQVPAGSHTASIKLTGSEGTEVTVQAVVQYPADPRRDQVAGFVEGNGVVSMEAEHYSRAVDSDGVHWLRVPDLSRTLSGMITTPVTAPSDQPQGNSPRLEYDMVLFSTGEVTVEAYFCPTQDYIGEHGIRYGISMDNEAPQIVNINAMDTVPDWKYPPSWNDAVMQNIKKTTSRHVIKKPGPHTLKFWRVDPGLVLQKIVVNTGGLQPSYLGPPESFRGTGAGAAAAQ